MNSDVINWLLENDNPAVKYRTERELLDISSDISQSKDWIFSKLPIKWHEAKGLWYIYYITALAECGLSYLDIPDDYLTRAFEYVDLEFEFGCADFMLLTSLLKLGLHNNSLIQKKIDELQQNALPDGGFLCKRRYNKLKYMPKSCYKDNLHALRFLAECSHRGIEVGFERGVMDYFFNRSIFYTSIDDKKLVIDSRAGWGITDVFHPFEPMRMGIHNIIQAFSALGYGSDVRLKEAWKILNSHRDKDGKIILSGTLTKSYLPKEKVGRPSKWATFYSMLAEKQMGKS